jgi:hypothetical protein
MRQDGAWFSNALEPNTAINGIINLRDANNQVVEYSKLRYTCDEFPPATWVEGGDNTDGNTPAQTRCAGMRCGTATKSEQDCMQFQVYFLKSSKRALLTLDVAGQATSHGKLRSALEKVIIRRQEKYQQFSYYEPKNSIILFGFAQNNVADGYAARVWTYSDPAMSQVEDTGYVTQAKKRADGEEGNFTFPTHRWPAEVNITELEARIKSGHGTEYLVPANDSWVNWSDLTGSTMHMLGMNGTDQKFRWDDYDEEEEEDEDWSEDEDEDEDEDEVQEIREEPKLNLKEEPVTWTKHQPALGKLNLNVRTISDSNITPLLKRATSQQLQDARTVVEQALAESSKLNQARLAKPLRNTYGLRPGTVVGGSIVPNATTNPNQDVTPLLQITDQIAEAAALVAEADAVATTGNATKRAVAAAGTYWMEALARKGTVPWGDDPAYVVFRNVLDYGAVGDGVTVSLRK